MAFISKKLSCSVALTVILFHFLFPFSVIDSSGVLPDENKLQKGILLWEIFQHDSPGSRFSKEEERQVFRSVRRLIPNMVSLGFKGNRSLEISSLKMSERMEIIVAAVLVFLTIIIYIYRADGKKRFVN